MNTFFTLYRRAEENTDALLDGEKESGDGANKKQSQDDIDETVAKCKYFSILIKI